MLDLAFRAELLVREPVMVAEEDRLWYETRRKVIHRPTSPLRLSTLGGHDMNLATHNGNAVNIIVGRTRNPNYL
jgi:hypothetical protein